MGTPMNKDSDSPSPNALGDLRSLRFSKKHSFSHQSAVPGSSLLADDDSDDEDNDNNEPLLNEDGYGSHLIEEVELEDTSGGHNVSSDDSSDHAPNNVCNGSTKPFNNLDQSISNEYMKLIKAGHINDVLKATPPPPVAMHSRKRLQPQTKKMKNQKVLAAKSPLMVFYELFKDVPIEVQKHSTNGVPVYTATLVIEGQLYTANHISKKIAKQKACENFLNIMLARQLIERFEESPMETVVEDGENANVPKRPPQEDFPWPHFASLAMHNFLYKWKLKPYKEVINLQEEQSDIVKSPPKLKAGNMKKFPDNPKNRHPVQLLNEMKIGVKFIDTIIHPKTPIVFQMKCEIDGNVFTGQGFTKKAAKKECCIEAIECLWNFDFHAIEDAYSLIQTMAVDPPESNSNVTVSPKPEEHSLKRPYKCNICKEAFAVPCLLASHRKKMNHRNLNK